MRKLVMVSLAALAIASTPAAAVNLVTNGSFETGSFSGWTQFGDTSFSGVVSGNFIQQPTDGTFQAVFGPVGGFGGIFQTLTSGAGTYNISFDLLNQQGAGVDVQFDGNSILSSAPDDATYHSYSFSVAGGANSTLQFSFFNPPSYYSLDNVVVEFAAVPEPAAWALMLGGFGLAGAAMRRRRDTITVTA